MKNLQIKWNEGLINLLIIGGILAIYLYDNRVDFLNGVLAGISDFQ